MSILSNITAVAGWKWKLGAGVAAVSLIVVSGFWVKTQMENRRLVSEVNKLDTAINDPRTGFRVVIAKEQANRANLEAAVETQNAAIQKQSAESAAKLADATTKLAAAQRATRAAEKQVAVMLATPIKGNTVADRVADVDAMILGDLP